MPKKKGSIVFACGPGQSTRLWQAQITRFGADYNVLLCGLTEAGWSPRATDVTGISLDDYVTQLMAIMEKATAERPVVVGHFIAGTALLRLAARYPDKIKAAVVVGTAGCYCKRTDYQFGVEEKTLQGLLSSIRESFTAGARILMDLQFTEPDPADVRTGWMSDTLNDVTRNDLLACVTLMHQIDIRSELERIRTPTLIIAGERDSVVPIAAARVLQESILDSQLEVISDAGQIATLTRPSAFNSALERFLRQLRLERTMWAIYYSW